MPRAEAQKQAILMLKSMRHQDGTDLTGFKDPTGKALFVEMVETVRRSGAGFVAYQRPQPGADKPVPKISYVKGFEPWGWIIGTGIYIDDVDAIWRKSALQAAAVMSALMLLLAVAGLSTYRRMFGPQTAWYAA